MGWSQRPVIYEINTWAWLHDLSRRYGRAATLASVPKDVWDALGTLHADAVWLMGVWERSPAGLEIARTHEGLQAEFRRALPDFTPEDVVGSPYCARRYVVDSRLGGPSGLATARQQLAGRGLGLLLDFVPNHVAPDHPWAREHPEYFVRGTPDDLSRAPEDFHRVGDMIFACGRDPYFPPWRDVLQLDAFQPRLRHAAVQTLRDIGVQCDGVRCDMAMLLINRVFGQTWGSRVGPAPGTEYWSEIISSVRASAPGFLFVAEAYWDLEWELMQQGFDYCYDKRLYDRLEHDFAEQIRLHLLADGSYQDRLVRFIENHDEPRVAAALPGAKGKAAAVVAFSLPGAKLFHEGQFDGRRVKLPVQLGRRPVESNDADLGDFYRRLLAAVDTPALRAGEWQLCERSGWPDNQSYLSLLAWCWRKAEERRLIVVNYSDAPAQGRVAVPWADLTGRSWRLTDALSGSVYERSGDEMRNPGLYVGLDAWGFHFLTFEPGPS